jgi:hypothetical protein
MGDAVTKPRRHPDLTTKSAITRVPDDDEHRRRGVRGDVADEQEANARAVEAGIPEGRPESTEEPEGG